MLVGAATLLGTRRPRRERGLAQRFDVVRFLLQRQSAVSQRLAVVTARIQEPDEMKPQRDALRARLESHRNG